MRIAVCGVSRMEQEQLCDWIEGYCGTRQLGAGLRPVESLDVFWKDFTPGSYDCVVLGQEDVTGFLASRRIRDLDRNCRILMICDTDRYALQCVRLHVTDFILRPVTRARLERGLDLLLRQR